MFKSKLSNADLASWSVQPKNGDTASCVEFCTLPVFYDNVALPNGRRSGPLAMVDPEHELYRVELNGELAYGTLESRNKDFVFVISEKQVNALNFSENTLYEQLLKCDGIVKQVVNPDFANDLYGALAGNTWKRSNYIHNFNARSAGKIVAKLRGINECYMDFFGSGTEGEVQSHIENILCSYSFKLNSTRDPKADARRAKDLLRICESQPVKDTPPRWFSMWVGELGSYVGLLERMLKCCFHDQATLEEWEEFFVFSATLDSK